MGEIRQAAAAQPHVLIHGDLHEENILWPLADHPEGSAVGFLDFGGVDRRAQATPRS
ncbi:MAG: phosphotransferase [Actinobacteria bacterium]|nr:phosphotransferase [Actinomycetota bacterium]